MTNVLLCVSAAALVSTLSACGGPAEPANEVVVHDMNAMVASPDENMLSGEQPRGEPAAPVPAPKEEEAAAKPAPAKAAPPIPKPAEPAEPQAPTPTCAPEHRAAGHC